jgi:hypothetical protein
VSPLSLIWHALGPEYIFTPETSMSLHASQEAGKWVRRQQSTKEKFVASLPTVSNSRLSMKLCMVFYTGA